MTPDRASDLAGAGERKVNHLIELLITVKANIGPDSIEKFLTSLGPDEKAIVADIMRICFEVGQMNRRKPFREIHEALDSRPIQP